MSCRFSMTSFSVFMSIDAHRRCARSCRSSWAGRHAAARAPRRPSWPRPRLAFRRARSPSTTRSSAHRAPTTRCRAPVEWQIDGVHQRKRLRRHDPHLAVIDRGDEARDEDASVGATETPCGRRAQGETRADLARRAVDLHQLAGREQRDIAPPAWPERDRSRLRRVGERDARRDVTAIAIEHHDFVGQLVATQIVPSGAWASECGSSADRDFANARECVLSITLTLSLSGLTFQTLVTLRVEDDARRVVRAASRSEDSARSGRTTALVRVASSVALHDDRVVAGGLVGVRGLGICRRFGDRSIAEVPAERDWRRRSLRPSRS